MDCLNEWMLYTQYSLLIESRIFFFIEGLWLVTEKTLIEDIYINSLSAPLYHKIHEASTIPALLTRKTLLYTQVFNNN